MNGLKLNETQWLAIQPFNKRLRLIVYNNGMEEVCRKEYTRNLRRFLLDDEPRLFKGRLQLLRGDLGINVMVKGCLIGTIDAENLLNYLGAVSC